MPKLWNKGYSLNKEIEKFTVGDDYITDKNILKYDIYASIAHAIMLAKIGILKEDELKKLKKGFKEIFDLHNKNKFEIKVEDEDCHTAIENFLTKKYGDVGKKIHTGRSRNDQVLVALRLYEKDNLIETIKKSLELVKSILIFSEKNKGILMPGYTHMQKAMPSSVGLWASSFAESLMDDIKILNNCLNIVDQNPLGSAASYGVNLNLDSELTTKLLGFSKTQDNVLYAANSRGKFEVNIISSLSQIMLTLNKIASDLMLFTMLEFNYFELPKEFCTGSSIMPQKKNYDVLELLRAKCHILISLQFQLSGIISNLMSGYNRDFQLIKKPIIEAFDMTDSSLNICKLVFENLKVNKDKLKNAMTKELFATDEAYELVKKGMPFRDAYLKIGQNLDKVKVKDTVTVITNFDMIKKQLYEEIKENKNKGEVFDSILKMLLR